MEKLVEHMAEIEPRRFSVNGYRGLLAARRNPDPVCVEDTVRALVDLARTLAGTC